MADMAAKKSSNNYDYLAGSSRNSHSRHDRDFPKEYSSRDYDKKAARSSDYYKRDSPSSKRDSSAQRSSKNHDDQWSSRRSSERGSTNNGSRKSAGHNSDGYRLVCGDWEVLMR